jgi:hypothetical protein
MRSSTFNSETAPSAPDGATRWLRALLIAVLALALAIEAGTRLGFVRLSKIQRRIHAEYVAARQITPVASNGQATVLLVGNSLLLAGTAMPTLQSEVSGAAWPSRYAIENTQFLDWYFGLQRLLGEGSRPDRILLALSTNQLVSKDVFGEYFGHYMMNGRNVIDVASAAGLDSTEASNLLFANWSAWFGSKAEIRKWVAGHVLPDTGQLAAVLGQRSLQSAPLSEYSALIAQRLAELKILSRDKGPEIAILLMPSPEASDDDTEVVRHAGAKSGVRILVPIAMKELSLAFYRDGFHLNEQGGARFTQRLSVVLRQWMNSAR